MKATADWSTDLVWQTQGYLYIMLPGLALFNTNKPIPKNILVYTLQLLNIYITIFFLPSLTSLMYNQTFYIPKAGLKSITNASLELLDYGYCGVRPQLKCKWDAVKGHLQITFIPTPDLTTPVSRISCSILPQAPQATTQPNNGNLLQFDHNI